MIAHNPLDRPTAAEACDHPFFWSRDKRLGFLVDFSDRLERESAGSIVLAAVEAHAQVKPSTFTLVEVQNFTTLVPTHDQTFTTLVLTDDSTFTTLVPTDDWIAIVSLARARWSWACRGTSVWIVG